MTGWRETGRALVVVVALWLTMACSSPQAPPPDPDDGVIALAPPTAILWVDPDGDDAASGEQAEPLRTLTEAGRRATPGTQVRVAEGVYDGSVTTAASGTAEQRIAYVSVRQGAARIIGSEGSRAAWRNSGDFVDVVGFDISGASLDGLLSNGSEVRLARNRVHDFTEGNCLVVANRAYDLRDVDVLANITWSCGNEGLDHGIYVTQPGGTVANNVSFGNAGYGIHCWHNCNALTIANNLVYDNGEGGIVVGQGDSPHDGRVPADDFVVTNNMAVRNGDWGIREFGATGPANVFENNLVWENTEPGIRLQTGRQSGTLETDPLFERSLEDAQGVYELQADSPAVDAGTARGAPPVALDGSPRPRGRAVDIGVDER